MRATTIVSLILSAQTPATGVVRGHVVGPDGKALSGQQVVLHRVTGSSGLTVATGVSAATGSFTLEVKDPNAIADAVYFLAARYNNELYIGDAFKAPFDTATDHAVQVGVAATSARALIGGTTAAEALPPTGPPTPDPTRWLIWILPALALAAVAVMLFLGGARMPVRRRTLIEIARLDEAHASQPGDTQAYNARRETLLAQLGRHAEV